MLLMPSVPFVDVTPDEFGFTDVSDAALSTVIYSEAVAIAGLGGSTVVSITGSGSPQISINGGGWATSGTIVNGQTLQIRLTSALTFSTVNTATVTVGLASSDWSVTTLAEDTYPNAFSFPNLSDQLRGTLAYSSILNIAGINAPTPVTISGQGSPQFSIAGAAYGTSGNIENGQSLRLRLTTSGAFNTAYSATVDIGGRVDTWSATTEAAASIVYRGRGASGADQATYNFGGISLGTAAADRLVVVALSISTSPGDSPLPSSVKMAGVTMGRRVNRVWPIDANTQSLIYSAFVPSGTSGTLSVVLPAAARRCHYAVYTVHNAKAAAATDTSSASYSSAGAQSLSLNVAAGGVIVGESYSGSNASNITWSGLTERYQVNGADGGNEHSGASGSSAVAQSPRSVSITNTAIDVVAVCASFR